MEHTKQHIQKPFWYVFSFCWSRWIIFSRIDVWPLNLFMCIFDKIPITFFKFPSISSFFLFLYSQHSSFCEDAILLNVQKIFKPDNQQTISPFCHPGHFNFRQTNNFTDPILYHLLFYVSLRGKYEIRLLQFANHCKPNWSLGNALVTVMNIISCCEEYIYSRRHFKFKNCKKWIFNFYNSFSFK